MQVKALSVLTAVYFACMPSEGVEVTASLRSQVNGGLQAMTKPRVEYSGFSWGESEDEDAQP